MGQGASSSPVRVKSSSNIDTVLSCRMDGKRPVKSKFAEDVKKLTHAASKWKIGLGKRRNSSKLVRSVSWDGALCNKITMKIAFEDEEPRAPEILADEITPNHIRRVLQQPPSLGDILLCLGQYVRYSSAGINVRPSAADVVTWMRQADKALQLNGWTANSFLMESHIVFTFMLMQHAFELFTIRSFIDLKEMFYLCMYVSYTYNANEISYPLRPFLVKGDRIAFWDKCIKLSLSISSDMLKLNKDKEFYESTKVSLLRQLEP